MASVAEDVSSILSTLRALEERMKALKALLAPVRKERKPNSWILFTKRIDALLKENNVPFTALGESRSFASSLKKEKPYSDWSDADVLAKRNQWLADALLSCPVCEESPREDISTHRDCILEFAGKEPGLKNPVGAWMCAASTVKRTTTEVVVIADASPVRRTRGRPRKQEPEAEISLPGCL
jgi:hypothetical protein